MAVDIVGSDSGFPGVVEVVSQQADREKPTLSEGQSTPVQSGWVFHQKILHSGCELATMVGDLRRTREHDRWSARFAASPEDSLARLREQYADEFREEIGPLPVRIDGNRPPAAIERLSSRASVVRRFP